MVVPEPPRALGGCPSQSPSHPNLLTQYQGWLQHPAPERFQLVAWFFFRLQISHIRIHLGIIAGSAIGQHPSVLSFEGGTQQATPMSDIAAYLVS
jgi:hypothetical protein